jgi:hypothetical protein
MANPNIERCQSTSLMDLVELLIADPLHANRYTFIRIAMGQRSENWILTQIDTAPTLSRTSSIFYVPQ